MIRSRNWFFFQFLGNFRRFQRKAWCVRVAVYDCFCCSVVFLIRAPLPQEVMLFIRFFFSSRSHYHKRLCCLFVFLIRTPLPHEVMLFNRFSHQDTITTRGYAVYSFFSSRHHYHKRLCCLFVFLIRTPLPHEVMLFNRFSHQDTITTRGYAVYSFFSSRHHYHKRLCCLFVFLFRTPLPIRVMLSQSFFLIKTPLPQELLPNVGREHVLEKKISPRALIVCKVISFRKHHKTHGITPTNLSTTHIGIFIIAYFFFKLYLNLKICVPLFFFFSKCWNRQTTFCFWSYVGNKK